RVARCTPAGAQGLWDPFAPRPEPIVPRQWQHGDLDRRQRGVEPKDRTLLSRPLRRRRLVDRIRVDQEREQRTVDPTGRLYHERVVPRFLLLIEVGEVLAAGGLVR